MSFPRKRCRHDGNWKRWGYVRAVTKVRGGSKANVLPCSATAVADFRILPGETIKSVIAHVRKAIDDPDVTVRPIGENINPSPVADVDSASFRRLRRTVRQIFPDVVVAPSLVIAGTDTKHYVALADNSYRFLPTRFRKGDIARYHGTNERISVENYAEIIRFYIQLIKNTAVP